jgi:GTPase SAR1 family protein
VGKTQFINKIMTDTFDSKYVATLGVEVSSFENCAVWDTAGQEKFSGEGTSYYKGSTHAIIMYDDRMITRAHANDFLLNIRNICGDIPVLSLQNKIDCSKAIKMNAISVKTMSGRELMNVVNNNFGKILLS